MSNPALDQIRGSKAPLVTELVAETRIDSPHAAGNAPPANSLPADLLTDEAAAAMAAVLENGIDLEGYGREEPYSPLPDPEAISRQFQAQATQLAEHLRSRQQELDHREAELNAWSAQLERDTRAARLWLEERSAEFEDIVSPPENILVQEDAIRRMAESLTQRERLLAQSEAELETQRTALQQFHEQLTADRKRLDEESQAERERVAAEQVRSASELEARRREVELRGEQADNAHAALERFRAELGRMNRETLEIRLATEELWAELSGTAPPAALTRSLGRIRSRLADHYRVANLELHEKKEELERLRNQLSQQYEKLVRQKHNFDAWSAECREEVDQQAARLLAQGRELDARAAEMAENARRAQAEKLDLQQEVSRLRAKLIGKAEAELRAT